ncbi:hypothetical protein Taro_032971 [Colocasia esculenta]|uniref:Pentatricopeptide repeat-containing protein n=1 Tax=Colocasia esculenta TaxID=4460 RepID=A0A843W3F2_COLES|nr:hypothetical protein [Colocasia esculenta]
MRNVRSAASAVFFSTCRFSAAASSSSPAPAGELADLLLVASISKAFSRPGAPVPVDPASISEAVVLQVLRRSSLHPSAKAHFFRWASSLPSYDPSPAAFSELLRSHCRAGLLDDLRPILRLAAASSPGGRTSLEPDALKLVLDTLIRAGRVDAAIAVLDDVEALVGGGEGAAASATLHPRMYNSIVLALLKKSQVGLALSIFKKLMETSAGPEHLACNELLVALRRADMKDEFRKVFDVLSKRGFRFDTWGYNICIHAFGCWGQLDVALKLFKEMKEYGPPEAVSDICTYNSLIGALCSAGKVHNALLVYEELKFSGHEPDQFTYRTLIQGCCRVYLLDDAIRVFREMEYNNVRADTVVYNSLLHGLFKVKKIADACQLFEGMVSEGVRASCYTYNILIDGLFKNGRSAAAFSLFNDLKKKGQFVDSVTYSIVVMHFCRDGQVDRALELVEEMETRGLTVDLVTVTMVLVALHKSGRWDWAERLMKHVRDSNLVPSIVKWTTDMEASMRRDYQDRRKDYIPLFPAAGDFDDVISWMNPSSERDTDDVNLDGECRDTWSSSPYMDRLADNFHTFKDFRKFSVHRGKRVQQKGIRSFDIDMVNTYLSIFLAKGKLSVACKLFEIFTEVKDPSIYTYNSLLSYFVKKGYFNVAWGVLQEMGEKFCPADIATYNVIIQGLGKMGKAELASAVLDQLMKKGGYLDLVMYNTLIHALGKAGRLDEANRLFKQMTGSGINPDVVTFNTLIEIHAKAGRVKGAYKFLRMMLDAGCSPNHVTDTILDFLEKEIEKMRCQKITPPAQGVYKGPGQD